MPRQVAVRRREDASDQSGRSGVDPAVGLNLPSWNATDPLDDQRDAVVQSLVPTSSMIVSCPIKPD